MTVPLALLQAPTRDGLSMAADISTVVVGAVAVLLVAMTGIFLMRLTGMLGEIRRSLRQNLGPVSDRARTISDNVEFITEALRTDVQRLNASVRALTERLHQASDHLEHRIDDFNALMEMVQSEAEEIFLDTASTVRGVREGTRSITSTDRHLARRQEKSDEPAKSPSDEVDALAAGEG